MLTRAEASYTSIIVKCFHVTYKIPEIPGFITLHFIGLEDKRSYTYSTIEMAVKMNDIIFKAIEYHNHWNEKLFEMSFNVFLSYKMSK